jgi:CRISPR/Cas system CSM-associated protein Csm3 (group 7 of RAMP superfamily)
MKHRLQIKIALRSATALAVGKGSGEGTIIDNSIMRNSQNLPYIPGSQMKGMLRARTSQLCNSLQLSTAIVTELFGSEFGTDAQPGSLRFAHLTAVITPEISSFASHIRTSVTINRRRRIAEDQLLRTIEVANDGLTYQNDSAISGVVTDKLHAALVYAALLVNVAWGHSKSRGLGWMETEEVNVEIDGENIPHQDLIDMLSSIGNNHHA